MTEKEKEVQRALGLEKGFVVRLSVEVPTYVSIPIVAKGFSKEEVRNRLHELSDDVKKQIILHTCKVILAAEDRGLPDRNDIYDGIVNDLHTISKTPLRNIDPKGLDIDYIDMATNTDDSTVADAIKHITDYDLTDYGYLDEADILII